MHNTVNAEMTDKDNPEWTDAMFANATRGATAAKLGRPKKDNPKERVTIRLSPEITAFFRAQGTGWQTQIDAVLRDYVKTHS